MIIMTIAQTLPNVRNCLSRVDLNMGNRLFDDNRTDLNWEEAYRSHGGGRP